MKKKILITLIAVCTMLFAFGMINVSAETYGDLTYEILNGEVTITDCNESSTTVEIPSEIESIPVTSIGGSAFEYCRSLTSIDIPDSVTSIGRSAFGYCSNLTSITIPDSVTSIGSRAFNRTGYYNCESNWENGILYIDNWLVEAENNITSVNIKQETIGISNDAFSDCTSLIQVNWNAKNIKDFLYDNHTFSGAGKSTDGISIIFGEAVESIPAFAFSPYIDIPKVRSVSIIGPVASIGYDAFSSCQTLRSVNFGDEVLSVGAGAFSACAGLTSVNFGKSITNIGENAFNGCTSLTNITIPDSVTSIGSMAFSNCSRLKSITIPENVSSIGDGAFSNCKLLTQINWSAKNARVTGMADNCFANAGQDTDGVSVVFGDKVESIPAALFYSIASFSKIKSVLIGENVTSIGMYAFCGCNELTNITIGQNVTEIGRLAFNGCTSLTNITIPDSVTEIGDSAFGFCRSLINITIPTNITSILENTFYCCSELTSVTIPNKVTAIGNYAFYGCDKITTVNYNGNETSWNSINSFDWNTNEPIMNATRNYFWYVTLLDKAGNEISRKMCTTNSTIDVSDIVMPDENELVLYSDKDLSKRFDITTPITKNLTLYADFENMSASESKKTKTVVSKDKKSFTITPINIGTGKTVILALYNGEQFVEMQKTVYAGDAIPFTTDKTYTDAKVMVLDDITNLKPVCDVEIVK